VPFVDNLDLPGIEVGHPRFPTWVVRLENVRLPVVLGVLLAQAGVAIAHGEIVLLSIFRSACDAPLNKWKRIVVDRETAKRDVATRVERPSGSVFVGEDQRRADALDQQILCASHPEFPLDFDSAFREHNPVDTGFDGTVQDLLDRKVRTSVQGSDEQDNNVHGGLRGEMVTVVQSLENSMPTLVCLGNFRLHKRLLTVTVECQPNAMFGDSLLLKSNEVPLTKLRAWLQIEYDGHPH
jgi:hypothetical protein